jgi:hypothetical protein
MKTKLIFTSLMVCAILGCKKTERVSQAGVYKLENQTVSGGGKDSLYQRSQYKFIPIGFLCIQAWRRILQ